jgi:hypothetical protein
MNDLAGFLVTEGVISFFHDRTVVSPREAERYLRGG